MTKIKMSRIDTLEMEAKERIDPSPINYHRNILEQAQPLRLEAHEVARHIIKANEVRGELLNGFGDMDFLFDDTGNLHSTEKAFLNEYRAKTRDGSQFDIQGASSKEVVRYAEEILKQIADKSAPKN